MFCVQLVWAETEYVGCGMMYCVFVFSCCGLRQSMWDMGLQTVFLYLVGV